jgi:hypothetical protein
MHHTGFIRFRLVLLGREVPGDLDDPHLGFRQPVVDLFLQARQVVFKTSE